MDNENDPLLNPAVYQWAARLFTTARRILRVNIKVHDPYRGVGSGEIFLFNHFARFETFIPQYFIYQETGDYCRSVAAHELFGDDAFGNLLRDVGAVPNNHPRLLAFLAEEILRGNRVVFFPEGGMVKDRRVLDEHGRFSIYSSTSRERRKHHTGAAVLALALDAYKLHIRAAFSQHDNRRIEKFQECLDVGDRERLRQTVFRPTQIIPANITFYPLRVSENILNKGAELLTEKLGRRATEELLIEGNFLLKHTDMDIRLGKPIDPRRQWRKWELQLFRQFTRETDTVDDLLDLETVHGNWQKRAVSRWFRNKSLRLRNDYMHDIYNEVTINLSHLAACLILYLLDKKVNEILIQEFNLQLYLGIKEIQNKKNVYLHRSLQNPEQYANLESGDNPRLSQFLQTSERSGLLGCENKHYQFLDKLQEDHGFHDIRLENPIVVYANEAAPIRAVHQSVEKAQQSTYQKPGIGDLRFDDLLRQHQWDQAAFHKSLHADINEQETATESGEPFLLKPAHARSMGIVVVHGFLASPAEVRSFAEQLLARDFTVIGVRLKGHGTSPWDLRSRSWQDWYASVEEGIALLQHYVDDIALVGFSTGGSLVLKYAAEHAKNVRALSAISVPMRFQNRNMIFVPLLHGANKVASWLPYLEGVLPFRSNESEHPAINYRHIPIRGLYELRLLVDEIEKILPDIKCPTLLLQGTEDQVVDAQSAQILMEKLGTRNKRLISIESTRHGILNENIGDTQERVLEFLMEQDQSL